MSIKVNCLACGHPMELSDAYENYEGEVRCWGCRAMIEVTLHEGSLQKMRLVLGEQLPPEHIHSEAQAAPLVPGIRVS